MKPVIEIRNVSKKYKYHSAPRTTTFGEELSKAFKRVGRSDTFYALKDISLDIEPGESIGIIGNNGAGKSTLLKILSRITTPTSGEITIRGSLRSILEVGTGFHPELTGRENIFLNGAIHGLSRKAIKNRFDEIVDFSGLEKFLDTPFKHYSSGMMMRLAFSVISHVESDIFISDEVLAVGDAEFREKSMKKMQDVFRQGRTILFVSHIQSMVAALTRRCVLLDHGEIVAIGPTHDVLSRYASQNKTSQAYFENKREWKPDKHAKLRNAGVYMPDEKTVAPNIRIDSSIVIVAEFDVVIPGGMNLEFVIRVKTDKGSLAFMSPYREIQVTSNQKCRVSVVCEVPPDVLNAGQYFVTVSLVSSIPFFMEHFCHDSCLSFVVFDDKKHDFVNYYGDYTGICNPKLSWKHTKERKV